MRYFSTNFLAKQRPFETEKKTFLPLNYFEGISRRVVSFWFQGFLVIFLCQERWCLSVQYMLFGVISSWFFNNNPSEDFTLPSLPWHGNRSTTPTSPNIGVQPSRLNIPRPALLVILDLLSLLWCYIFGRGNFCLPRDTPTVQRWTSERLVFLLVWTFSFPL